MFHISRYGRISAWIGVIGLFAFLMLTVPASANIKILKNYKKAFPEMPPKCLYCHVDKMPKKETGRHKLNAYGLEVKKHVKNNIVSVDELKKLGSQADFEKAHGK